MDRPKIIVFASGTVEEGGSGFENLATSAELDADIVGAVSNHEHGGVRKRADRLGIPFTYFPGPYTAEAYQRIVKECGAEWAALSGWVKLVKGLDPKKTFNIHPAPLSTSGTYGGNKMYGHYLHEQIARALEKGEIDHSAVAMHFVTDEYDRGPIFFEQIVPLRKGMSADDIQKAVYKVEHEWQPRITNLVVHGRIHWDGKTRRRL
jgi:phosphoribosylglycinamide formyltransferase-1